MITTDKEFAAAERSDRLFAAVLGKTLERATLQLGVILGAICALAAGLAVLVH